MQDNIHMWFRRIARKNYGHQRKRIQDQYEKDMKKLGIDLV